MSLLQTEEMLANAISMIDRYKKEAEKIADQIATMKSCQHVWDRDTAILAEMDGRDLSYYEAKCHMCGILKSEFASLTF